MTALVAIPIITIAAIAVTFLAITYILGKAETNDPN